MSTRPLAPFVPLEGLESMLSEERLAAVVERRELAGIVYQLERVRCSSKGCWCREAYPDGGHGPYWYAYYVDEVTRRWRNVYIGKDFREL